MFTTQDNLDSRYLRYTDCYGQRFMREGAYHYNVLPSGGRLLNDERPFVIQVQAGDGGAGMRQHNVMLDWSAKGFKPDHREISIAVGDLVLWRCASQVAPPYEVAGDHDFFGSASLVNECGFSHAFGHAGVYEWADANGSGIGGVVRVMVPDCKSHQDIEQWRSRLANGKVVMVSDGRAEPQSVEIEIGQTVFFAIVAGQGITVTDKRLHGLGGGGPCA